MIRINEIKLPLNADEDDILSAVCRKLSIDKSAVRSMRIAKKSVDSRRKDNIHFSYSVDIDTSENESAIASRFQPSMVSVVEEYVYTLPDLVRKSELRPIIVGFGPAGMFAALMLARAGLKPIILERGDTVDVRTQKVNTFWKERILDENSNVQFGEGGAGTFSDGKLTTGIKDKRCRVVFKEFVRFGAPEDILYSATPHIGTDRLRTVVKSLREEVIALGGEVRFCTRLTGIITANGCVHGVSVTENEKSSYDIETDTVILAIGHSSRDTYEMLFVKGLELEQKAFSMGMRIEHPQEYINKAQYGATEYKNPLLPPADYKLSDHPQNGRGAYTFCMCPGGYVVAASSEKGCVTVNGMSEYKRDNENANSAILAGIEPKDFPDSHVLSGMYLQREIEKKAYLLAGENYSAPMQLLGDFLNHSPSKSFGAVRPSCPTGGCLTDIHLVLPKPFTDTLERGIKAFDGKLRGFILPDAVLTAPETRSSAPVRIKRDEFMNATRLSGLIPCGEGAGYAGGIVSAAVDGIKAAEQVIAEYGAY